MPTEELEEPNNANMLALRTERDKAVRMYGVAANKLRAMEATLNSIATRASCAPHDDEDAASKEFTAIMNTARNAAKQAEVTA